MGIAQWAIFASVGLPLTVMQVDPEGYHHSIVQLAQGTDQLPGGVEHIPTPGGPSNSPDMSMPTSAPVRMPEPPAAPAASSSGTQVIPNVVSPDSNIQPQDSKGKKSKSKKAAPAKNGDSHLKSMKPRPSEAPSTPNSNSSGDDRLPGGVEHVPSGAAQ